MFLSLIPPAAPKSSCLTQLPQTACISPASQGFANPFDSESLLTCFQGSWQAPDFFPEWLPVLLTPCPSKCPSLLALPASKPPPGFLTTFPRLRRPTHHQQDLLRSLPPRSLRDPLSPQRSLPHPHFSDTPLPPSWTSIPHARLKGSHSPPHPLLSGIPFAPFWACKNLPPPPPHYPGTPPLYSDFTTRNP